MKITYFTLVLILLCSCNNGNKVTIKGDISGMKDPIILAYGNLNDKNGDEIDTIKVHDGEFAYHIKLEKPTCIYLVFPGCQRCPVYVSPGDGVKIKGKAPKYALLKVKGGDDTNNQLNDFKKKISDYYTDEKRVQVDAENFIRTNINSPISAFLLDEYFVQSSIPSVDKIRTLMNLLRTPAAIDPLTKQINAYLSNRNGLAIGSAAPLFSSTTNKGKTVSISDYKGRYLLIHFWASWQNNYSSDASRLCSINKKYNNKLSLLGISLDMDRMAWNNEIKKDNMIWPQVCDFTGFESYMAKQFDVTSLPKYALISTDGKILLLDSDINTVENRIRLTIH